MNLIGESERQVTTLRLVPAGSVAAEALYSVLYEGNAAPYWRTRGRVVSIDAFTTLLDTQGFASFGVVAPDLEDRLIGYVGLYNVDIQSLVGTLSAFFDQRVKGSESYSADAIRRFLDYVFTVLGLRKLLIETPEPISAALLRAVARSDLIEHEGTLRQHTRIGQSYVDLHHLAIWASAYLERRPSTTSMTAAGTLASVDRSADVDPFDFVVAILRAVSETPPAIISGGHRLVEDLGLCSIDIVEVLTEIYAQTGRELERQGSFDSPSGELCVQDLVELCSGSSESD